MKFTKILIGVLFVCLFGNVVFAGGETNNGGDECERRIQEIRTDLAKWIQMGGSTGLKLPSPLTLTEYRQKMSEVISNATVSCQNEPVKVGDLQKTCKNFIDQKNNSNIICNRNAFMRDTTEEQQYVLTHHEYAGLAGFELNNGAKSNYDISDQLTGYLETLPVTKLSLRRATPVQDCATLDLRNVPKGTQCKTSKGKIFELLKRTTVDGEPNETWRDHSANLIWYDAYAPVGFDHYESATICGRSGMGTTLPTFRDFMDSQNNGFREVLPRLDLQLWAATIEKNYPLYAFLYFGNLKDGGMAGGQPRSHKHNFRCVERRNY